MEPQYRIDGPTLVYEGINRIPILRRRTTYSFDGKPLPGRQGEVEIPDFAGTKVLRIRVAQGTLAN